MDLVSLEKIQGSVDYSPAWSHYSTSSQATPCPIIQRIYLRMSMERSNICSTHDLTSCFNCQYVLGISHDFLAPFKQRLENFYAVFAMYRNIKDINNNLCDQFLLHSLLFSFDSPIYALLFQLYADSFILNSIHDCTQADDKYFRNYKRFGFVGEGWWKCSLLTLSNSERHHHEEIHAGSTFLLLL